MNETKDFAIVVEGEVVQIMRFTPDAEMQIAIYSSDPIIVPIPELPESPTPNDFVNIGFIWDGSNFIKPQ